MKRNTRDVPHAIEIHTSNAEVMAPVSGRDGFAVRVRPGASASLTVALHPRKNLELHNTVDVGEGAFLELDERLEGCANGRLETQTDLHLARGARLVYRSLQNLDAGAVRASHAEFILATGAQANMVRAEFGAQASHVVDDEFLDGEGALMENASVFCGTRTQQFDLSTNLRHQAPRTRSRVLVKGCLRDGASSLYRGRAHIEKNARGADTYVTDRVLHLSRGVRSDSIPALVIDTNDVKAGHAAAVSRLDADQLFYLASRGLPLARAERLVVDGFIRSAIPEEAAGFLNGEVPKLLEQKIAAAHAARQRVDSHHV